MSCGETSTLTSPEAFVTAFTTAGTISASALSPKSAATGHAVFEERTRAGTKIKLARATTMPSNMVVHLLPRLTKYTLGLRMQQSGCGRDRSGAIFLHC